jgi:hypothetical protein
MLRKQIYLRADQERRLRRLARELGVSEAELIRQSVDRAVLGVVRAGGDPEAWAAELKLAKRRQGKGPLAGRRDWAREEIYDRGRVPGQ